MLSRYDVCCSLLCRVAWVLAGLWLVACGDPDERRPVSERPRGSPNGDGDEVQLGVLPSAERAYDQPYRDESERADASKDSGWDTEVLQDQASALLKEITHAFEAADEETFSRELLPHLESKEFRSTELRPEDLEEIHAGDFFSVHRASTFPWAPHTGAAAAVVFERLRAPLKRAIGVRAKSKLFKINLESESTFRTESYFNTFGEVGGAAIQQNATWTCLWTRDGDGAGVTLQEIEATQFEEVRSERGVLLKDATRSVMTTDLYESQLRLGVGYWEHRLERTVAPDITGMMGLAVGDANGDGLDDVFLCQPYGLPNRLLVQQPDATVVDTAPASKLDWVDPFASALFVDLDNDGDQDLVLGGDTSLFVYSNDGSGRFAEVKRLPFPVMPDSLAAADYDGDRLVDLYVCGHTPAGKDQQESVLGLPVPFYDANNGQANRLLRNRGNWEFEDVTKVTGLDANNRRFSYAAAWEDYDNDGDLDLYVANDFGRNNLFQNVGGKFKDVAREAGVEDISSGMSVDWADYDNDGWMDLYVGNMFSSAGNRITYQRNFRPGEDARKLTHMRRMARGNSLFQNGGDGTFRDVSEVMNVTMGRWSWASKFTDLNNDGLQDLLIANGWVTNRQADDL